MDVKEIQEALSLHWKTIQEMLKKMECLEENFKNMKTMSAKELDGNTNHFQGNHADMRQRDDNVSDLRLDESKIKSEIKRESAGHDDTYSWSMTHEKDLKVEKRLTGYHSTDGKVNLGDKKHRDNINEESNFSSTAVAKPMDVMQNSVSTHAENNQLFENFKINNQVFLHELNVCDQNLQVCINNLKHTSKEVSFDTKLKSLSRFVKDLTKPKRMTPFINNVKANDVLAIGSSQFAEYFANL